MKAGISTILFVLALAGCAATNKSAKLVFITPDKVSINLSTNIRQPNEIDLPSGGFSIVAPKIDDDVAIQVCASANRKIIDQIKIGGSIDSHPCFTPGTGMAMRETQPPLYSVPLIIKTGEAHNYYSDDRRRSDKDTTIISVNEVANADETPLGPTYLVVLIDRNKNSTLDDGELWIAKITWK